MGALTDAFCSALQEDNIEHTEIMLFLAAVDDPDQAIITAVLGLARFTGGPSTADVYFDIRKQLRGVAADISKVLLAVQKVQPEEDSGSDLSVSEHNLNSALRRFS